MGFAPIAVIGAGCVLPGARTPGELWDLALSGRVALGPGEPARWRAPHWHAGPGRQVPRVCGAVTGPTRPLPGVLLPPEELAGADPVLGWTLDAAHQALASAGIAPGDARLVQAGAVIGNLSYPTRGLARWAEAIWTGAATDAPPADRFSSGLPVHRLGRALGLGAPCFALDAACASALYAIRLASDRLADGTAELMLAGGVNAIDPLVLQAGFHALGALSPSGRSRPFHAEADGLVPAEGAAVVLLKRLDRALADGDPIRAVILGIGLSNDGRAGGVLAPSAEGQALAIERAHALAGIAPAEIGLVECHATGTARGDTAELAALGRVHAGRPRGGDALPIGSLKANIGHPVTAAGAAGLIKLVEALGRGVLPPGPPAREALLPALAESPFTLLEAARAWPADRLRLAGLSAFGFGGTNAHLIVAAPEHGAPRSSRGHRLPAGPVAVVGLALRAGVAIAGPEALAAALGTTDAPAPLAAIELPLAGLRLPPADLERALPQHALALQLAREAVAGLADLPRDRTLVAIGAQCDPEAARHALRLRLPDLVPGADPASAGVGVLAAPEVLGCMPNLPANRINAQFDLRGPGFTVAAEELSGLRALEIALRALRAGEADLALVGAVDLAAEPVHAAAIAALRPGSTPGDGGVVLALRRLADARAAGEPVLALLDAEDAAAPPWPAQAGAALGEPHAAAGLLAVAAAIAAAGRAALPGPQGPVPWLPDPAGRQARVQVAALGGEQAAITVTAADRPALPAGPGLQVELHRAADRAGLRASLAAGAPAAPPPPAVGPAIVLWGCPAEHAEARDAALALLAALPPDASLAAAAWPAGVAAADAPLAGELAFVFTGSAAAYPGMGRDLLLGFPDAVDALQARCAPLRSLAGWIYAGGEPPDDYARLCGASLLCQVHAELSRGLLGLRPAAAIGLSSGETNALFAFGVWTDMAEMLAEVKQVGLYEQWLAGEYQAVRSHWAAEGIATAGAPWENWQVLAPLAAVQAAISGLPGVGISIANSPVDCLIGGPPEGCAAAVARLGGHRAVRAGFDIACHTRAALPAAGIWRRLHHRATSPVAGLRLYGNAWNAAYEPSAERIAEALTRQAMDGIDFPATILRAWEDGVRIFVEHGPRNMCSQSIGAILEGRPHLAVALDRLGQPGLRQLARAAAELAVAGVPVDLAALNARLAGAPAAAPAAPTQPVLRLPAHPPRIELAVGEPGTLLAPAPALAPPAARPAMPRPVESPPKSQVHPVAGWHAAVTEAHLAHLGHARALLGQFLRSSALLLQGVGGPAPAAMPAFDPPAPVASARPMAMPVPMPVPVPVPRPAVPPPPAPMIDRSGLVALATGPLAAVLGPDFAVLDGYRRLVRMPAPPLLLADRVMALQGRPLGMGLGRIVTETDVTADAWYLQHGRMPAGLLIEAGQADLLLISWLGADLGNRGERVYRLLGCELTFHGALPAAGETLRFDIRIEGHARQGELGLFFFGYDCTCAGRPMLTVREGQAGFFTDAELVASEGVLWSPETAEPTPAATARLDAPPQPARRRSFGAEALDAWHAGRIDRCFGAGFEAAGCHTRSPGVPAGRLAMLQAVELFDPGGGPWGRGYLRARRRIARDDWFFEGHFKDDPCMPGTVMFEACLETMAFYLAACGFTLERDGWRFEPVPEEAFRLRCRGQVTPAARELVFELFVDELVDGPQPILYADLLCSVDGLKAFHCRRMGIRLVPDWPLEAALAVAPADPVPAAEVEGVQFDHTAMLACALGRPSRAFGPHFARFDDGGRLPRLPAPPYHFMSRVAAVEGAPRELRPGLAATAECDLPPEAWFMADGSMPFGVLMEAALQPCGWLASFGGVPLLAREELHFRNLDGTATVRGEVLAGGGPLVTRTMITGSSRVGDMVIVNFDVRCSQDGRTVMEMQTVFGFFPRAVLAGQAGLPPSAEDRRMLDAAETAVPALDRNGPGILERLTGLWPEGGRAGLGAARGAMRVSPDAWFFKAHFFQDPVQPGSLGIAAMLDVLRHAMIGAGLARGFRVPVFDPVRCDVPNTWRYRGEVSPRIREVVATVEILAREPAAAGEPVAVAALAILWADGKKIYEATLGLVLREAGPGAWRAPQQALPAAWLADHCPTFTVPALPLAGATVLLMEGAAARAGAPVVGVRGLHMQGWAVAGPAGLAVRVAGLEDGVLRLEAWREGVSPAETGFRMVARGRCSTAAGYPAPPAAPALPAGGEVVHDPAAGGPDLYAECRLFHGPAFRVLHRLRWHDRLAVAELRRPADMPGAAALPAWPAIALLDGVTQAVPNDAPERWFPAAAGDRVGFPLGFEQIEIFAPLCDWTEAVVLVRVADATALRLDFTILRDGAVLATGQLAYGLFPKGPLGRLPPRARAAFLRDRVAVAGAGLFATEVAPEGGVTTIARREDVLASDWCPGTIAAAYGVAPADPRAGWALTEAGLAELAVREHAARRLGVHPAMVAWDRATGEAGSPDAPGRSLAVTVGSGAEVCRVSG